jgi:spore coat protein U-like protein
MMRVLLAACCLLLSASVLAASPLPQSRGLGSRAPGGGGGGGACPAVPATCQVNVPTVNFGRAEMSQSASPIRATNTISVTCTRHPQDRLEVNVDFVLKAVVPDAPPRYMRDPTFRSYLAYDMYVDPGRTRIWGDGVTAGTETFIGNCLLDERNKVCTIPFVLYGNVPGQQPGVPPGQFLGAVIARVEYRFIACIP